MKAMGVVTIGIGILALFSAMLPLSEVNDYQYFVAIQHMGPILKILYLLPIGVIVVGIFTLTGKIDSSRPWFVVIGIIGLLLSSLGGYSAIDQLDMTARMFGMGAGSTVSLGLGTYALLFAYLVLIIIPFTPIYRANRGVA
jgi:hypothetical protein